MKCVVCQATKVVPIFRNSLSATDWESNDLTNYPLLHKFKKLGDEEKIQVITKEIRDLLGGDEDE